MKRFSDPEFPGWAFGDLAGSQCNLALVRLFADNRDGAAEAVRPVLDLSPATGTTASPSRPNVSGTPSSAAPRATPPWHGT